MQDLTIAELIEQLSTGSRRERQNAAADLAETAKHEPALVVGAGPVLIDALDVEEARTRWEALDALTSLVEVDSRLCDKALVGAENGLFDEDSGPVRLAAMRFLCKLGSTTENRSEKTWPLIDEAIQCYHGDPEFQDMLIAVTEYAGGKVSANVRESLAERMAFDAENGKGVLKRRAQLIIDACKAK